MIQIVVPQLSYVGDNDIQVKIPNNDSSSNILTFCVAPKIASLSKTSGPVCGTTLTIYGYGFDTNSTAYLDDNELIIANRQVNTQIQELQVTIPAANYVGVTYLRVKTANILSSNNSTQFSYIAPAIASISTTRGDIDKTTTITITGTNFGSTTRPDNLYVIIDNYTIPSVDVTYISTTQLTAKLPKLPEVSVQIGESNIFVNIGSINGPCFRRNFMQANLPRNSSTRIRGQSNTAHEYVIDCELLVAFRVFSFIGVAAADVHVVCAVS
jgi:hypothetical protein